MENVIETRRRNDIYEQNSLLQAEQLKNDKAKIRQQTAFRAFDELGKMADHPSLAMNLDKQADLLLMQSKVMETGLGITVPMPSKEELLGGFDQAKATIRAVRNGKPEEANAALSDMMIANPKWGRAMLDDMKKAGELTTQMQELDVKLQLHQADLEAKNVKIGKLKLQDNLYTEHVAAMGRMTNVVNDPAFSTQFHHVMKLSPIAREAWLNLPENASFKQAFDAEIAAEKEKMGYEKLPTLPGRPPVYQGGADVELLKPALLTRLSNDVLARNRALQDAQDKSVDGAAPKDMADEVMAYENVRNARETEARWLEDPYNKDKWMAFKKAEQNLRLLQGTTVKQQQDTVAERNLSLSQSKFDLKTQTGLKEALAQKKFLEGITQGKDSNQSAIEAYIEADKKYPGVPMDAGTLKDFNKTGKLSIDVNSPTTATRTKMQDQLTGLESTLNVIGNLKATVQQGNIGLAAALKSTAYGFTSQIKGMAETVGREAMLSKQSDPDKTKGFTPNKWFDPSLSTVDLLANTLAYRIINQEQGGRVSDKDFAEMKKRLNIDSLLAGKEDVLQRLTVMENQLKFEQSVYRRIMPKFGADSGAASSGEPATAADWLKSKGIDVPMEGN